ncbi:MAG: electron transfer flavoprotein subunit beta/FixA family protein [Deltaproteobacteria bacterium]|nr:electron transfer flavoprotein subunit beta/FixA family protein [Candidatus Tharpellaceae bacterium]
MNIIVCLKQTPDSETKIILDDNGRVDCGNITYTMNPYDEHALEEALRIKEKQGGRVTVISVLPVKEDTSFITQALAMGADQATVICDPLLENADQFLVAKAAAALLKQMDCDLILCGKEAIDDGLAQFPAFLAEFLDMPQINVVTALEISGSEITATREVDGGTETIITTIPTMITAQRGLNEVRYPPLSRIMRAKRIKINQVTLAELEWSDADIQPLVELDKIELPPARQSGISLKGDMDEIIEQLLQAIKSYL